MKIKFSNQATTLINNMPNFDMEAFHDYWKEKCVEVGSNNLLEYLMNKDK